jgi:hypothetical protein
MPEEDTCYIGYLSVFFVARPQKTKLYGTEELPQPYSGKQE